MSIDLRFDHVTATPIVYTVGAVVEGMNPKVDKLTEERDALRALVRRCIEYVDAYALRNPKWDHHTLGTQDPKGVHALLAELKALR